MRAAFETGIVIALAGATAMAAFAQDSNTPTAAPKVKVERSASGQKIFRITEGIVVEGRIQKPNAFYVLQRSSMDYDWESLKQDFLPKILDATGKHPF
jgi:hypothetical protein